MSKIKTKEECVAKVLSELPIVEDIYQTKLEFLGFDGEWTGSKGSKVILKCIVHNCIFTANYYNFISKHQISCKSCIENKYIRSTTRLTEDVAKEIITEKIHSILVSEGIDLEFLGFLVPSKFNRVRKNDKLIIRCKTHDKIGYPTYERFIRRGYYCEECTKERNSKSFSLSDEEIINRLTELHPGCKFSNLMRQDNNDSYSCLVTATCSLGHAPFQRTVQNFIKTGIHCPECDRLDMEAKCTTRVRTVIEERKQIGVDLRFDGFVDNTYIGRRRARLLLHCNKCNVSWNTTSYDRFLNGNTICGCPVCSGTNKISFPEEQCNKVLRDILGMHVEICRQYRLKKDLEHRYKSSVFVDFYIPSYNLIIEYNGEQHYEQNNLFHKTKKDFEHQIDRDRYVVDYCREFGIKLLVIPYVDSKRIPDIIKEFLVDGVDTTTKLTN